MQTLVVNLNKKRFDVYIGRPGLFGNPYEMSEEADRKRVIDEFRKYFAERIKTDEEFRKAVEALRGKVLGCYCKPKPCHGDVIAQYLNGTE